ncbi:MAG: hypothetical protein QF798_02450 [Candidatus Woesearchaeota archaeon]|nr:hypothetical protein [Candidatus Woesearchaeota archaeon]
MKISIENAENIFKNALEVLKDKIPEASEECEYCRWNAENQKLQQ